MIEAFKTWCGEHGFSESLEMFAAFCAGWSARGDSEQAKRLDKAGL